MSVIPRENPSCIYAACLWALLAGLLAASALLADVVPGRWEKVAKLSQGETVIVTLKTDDRIEGRFQGLSEVALAIRTDPAEERIFRKEDIAMVLSGQAVEDSTLNGSLIGAAAGFGAGFLAVVAWEKSVTASGYRLAEENLAVALLGGGLGAGVGALVGYLMDKSHKAHEVLYEAQK